MRRTIFWALAATIAIPGTAFSQPADMPTGQFLVFGDSEEVDFVSLENAAGPGGPWSVTFVRYHWGQFGAAGLLTADVDCTESRLTASHSRIIDENGESRLLPDGMSSPIYELTADQTESAGAIIGFTCGDPEARRRIGSQPISGSPVPVASVYVELLAIGLEPEAARDLAIADPVDALSAVDGSVSEEQRDAARAVIAELAEQ